MQWAAAVAADVDELMAEKEGDEELDVRWLLARTRSDGQPYAFFIDFGWDGALDVVRDVDLAIPGKSLGVSQYIEANVPKVHDPEVHASNVSIPKVHTRKSATRKAVHRKSVTENQRPESQYRESQ